MRDTTANQPHRVEQHSLNCGRSRYRSTPKSGQCAVTHSIAYLPTFLSFAPLYSRQPFSPILSPSNLLQVRVIHETSQINANMSHHTSDSPSSTNSSMSSSARFNLDPHDTSKILVYTYRVGVKTSSQQELCRTLDKGMCFTTRCGLSKSPPSHFTLRTHS